MTDIQIAEQERLLIKKERRYSELMRKSFEISLRNRERANEIHSKAKKLYHEIMETRRRLEYA
ncbi:hypothetical protein [Nonlabens marinus]|uniref:Uncharacterized protein n=1 Tax=Nonlabens marinus S1-08 TaxID=1454201 RepID=W8VRV6_9FLAO|nr:hypothetical protein [Nonlabens marinus]BAO55845.1 hypothetical protein NMS_1836 [Nonlabens marinus S1-08]